jgi:hypothetical protein
MDAEFLLLAQAPFKIYCCYSRFKPGLHLSIKKDSNRTERVFHTLEEFERLLNFCIDNGGTLCSKPKTIQSIYAGWQKYKK